MTTARILLPALLGLSLPLHAQTPEAVAGNEEVKKIMETRAGRGVMADDTPPTPPLEAVKLFTKRSDVAVDLMAAEPSVEQPLYVSWDSKGRMWVTQYRQYQFPAGLKIVSYDQHLRAKFDKIPQPPPRGEKGADKITVFEDTDGDGSFDKHTDVITGLNIASAALTGMGRIWVLNPPYLLSYADADQDGMPEGDPEVELSGFGLEDTHAVATSLMWGMDGWLYGANGSTTTGNVSSANSKNIRWEGQCIWRYQPKTKLFEIYAEGGGNTFSLDMDSKGRVFSGTNNGNTRGMHYEQGSYGIKGWGKHGPLTNPYAFGWFEHMNHEGDNKRFPQAYTIYEGGLLGSAYEGKIIAPNSLANVVYVSKLIPEGSTFRTKDEENLMSAPDRWFRPVWAGVGPDGGFYMADWYDTRLSHVSPVDDWHKTSGRIYRVRPASGAPKLKPFDLGKASSEELLSYLSHTNEWFRKQAALEIGWRGLSDLKEPLLALAQSSDAHALDALWTLDMLGAADDALVDSLLGAADPYVRRWAVKIIGEQRRSADALVRLAKSEKHIEVRAQILASAKRLGAMSALPLLWSAVGDEDSSGHIPLLAWWALESKAEKERASVFAFFKSDPAFLKTTVFRDHLARKLAQRYATAGGTENFESCADLLSLATDADTRANVIAGIAAAFEGAEMPPLPDTLSNALKDYLLKQSGGDLTLALRTGSKEALKQSLKVLGDAKASNAQRIAIAKTLAELGKPDAIAPMVAILKNKANTPSLKRGILQAAAKYDDKRLPETLLTGYETYIAGDKALREDALRVLAGRKEWALLLVSFVNEWKVPAKHFSIDTVRQLSLYKDPEIDAAIENHWKGLLVTGPTEAKSQEMARIKAVIKTGLGDADKGKLQFAGRCAICHKLFGEGNIIGPELTGYDRTNADFWLDNIFNPSLEIREGFGNYIVKLKNGQMLTGIMDAQDASGIVLKDIAGNKIPVKQAEIEKLEASPISLMPEALTTGMTDADLKDFFAYLMKL
ncbi:putative membrane-bound dehydrogenase-like protein [Prosthecobacter fusiformis]|uniref:Putative membrane-bound dehydrogenase-like protein n=1 Tax=Prosthecobacter fusiformis TaxID=48464 RepID=A0A4V3FI45_9BACT|nr:HEAT repeat domain-containing protein [Prosthecobacter fusiformis]TDU80993.1 putative membrane-bound dehydrogenase-like protein [Prosthecobacter fusiformis]